MAFHTFDQELFLGGILREGLDELRSARYKLGRVLGDLQQMTQDQAEAEFGFVDGDTGAKAELESDIAKLLSDDTGVNSAVVQMLNQFG